MVAMMLMMAMAAAAEDSLVSVDDLDIPGLDWSEFPGP